MIKVFITGPPGIGKTTAVERVVEMARLYDVRVGGFISKEVREEGRRIGFKIIDLLTGENTMLANISGVSPIKIGKYYVFIDRLNYIIDKISKYEENIDLLVIDEIGPMEQTSKKFRDYIQHTLSIDIPAIYTVHYKIANNLNSVFQTKYRNILYMVTRSNRDYIPFIIWREISRYLRLKRT